MKKFLKFIIIFIFFLNLNFAEENLEKNKEKKIKIVFIRDDDGPFFDAVSNLFGELFKERGYNDTNSEYIIVNAKGSAEGSKEALKKVIEINPDIITMNGVLINEIIKPLQEQTNIPTVIGINIGFEENGKKIFIDEEGYALSNIIGFYNMPQNYEKKSIEFLNMISPIRKGKKAIMIAPKEWPVDIVNEYKKGFEELGIEYDILLPKYWEEVEKIILEANENKEIDWIISDPAFKREDGVPLSMDEANLWIALNSKKPGMFFFENGVQKGQLCALAIDSMATVNAMADMAVKILKGEDIENIKAEYPPKFYMIINMKTAKRLNIEIPLNIMGAAWKIYTDYEGNYIGKGK